MMGEEGYVHHWVKESGDMHKLEGGYRIKIHNTGSIETMLFDYAEKYMKSAYSITDYMLERSDISVLDTFFFPIAFLFRHSIELCLKACIFVHVIEEEQRIDLMDRTKHNLRDLFEELETHIGETVDLESNYVEWLKSFLCNINDVDKESDSFRYPFGITIYKDLQGNKEFGIKTLFGEQTHIDLVKFGNKMLFAYEIVKSIYLNTFDELDKFPEVDPTLFEEGGQYYAQCVVGYKYSHEKFHPFVRAYKDAPKVLYDLMMSTEGEEYNQSAREMFLPMCYLFRNATELLIKQIMFEESSYGYQGALKKFSKKKHKIVGLWNLIIDEIVQHADADESDTTDEIAFNYINQINDIDVRAYIFRYPINNRLCAYFTESKEFDVENVYEFFMEILNLLDAVDSMMSVHNEWKADMEYEMQQCYSDYYNDY